MIRALALALPVALPAAAEEQEGCCHPPVTSEEAFDRSLIAGPKADALAREAFVGLLTQAQLQPGPHPRFSLFAKGDGSRRLIMVGLDDEAFRTLSRARAVLAQMTRGLRASPFFREQGLEATATFLDVLQLMDFESLTLSDGDTWSHRINFR